MKKRYPVLRALAQQAVGMSVLAALVALSGLALTGTAVAIVHTGGLWAGAGALEFWLSMRCAKAGVPAIAAWPIGSILFTAVYWLLVGMAPSMGAMGLCALLGVLGGSAGEVWLRRSGG